MSLLASIFTPWNNDAFFSQLFWDLGLIGLCLVALQAILSVVFGHHADAASDGGHGFAWNNYLSLKAVSAMLLGVGFGGALISDNGFSMMIALAGGVAIGLLLAIFFVALMKGLYQLRSDGTVRLWEAIGQRGTVYMRIPGQEVAPGEIQVAFAGRLINIPAFTRGPELPTGTDVLVISVHGEHALEVEKASNDQLKLS